MNTINNIVNWHKFTSLVSNYTGIKAPVLNNLKYDLGQQALGPDNLALQEIRLLAPPASVRRDVDLTKTTFVIIYRPTQEKYIGISGKRSFRNHFYMIEETSVGGKCYFRELTGAGPEHGMQKVAIKNMKTAKELIVDLAHEADALDIIKVDSEALIAEEKDSVKKAQRNYLEKTQKIIEAARCQAIPQERE